MKGLDMLKRDTNNGIIAGVCAGIAKATDIDLRVVRVLTVISFLLSGSITFWAYVFAAILLDKE